MGRPGLPIPALGPAGPELQHIRISGYCGNGMFGVASVIAADGHVDQFHTMTGPFKGEQGIRLVILHLADGLFRFGFFLSRLSERIFFCRSFLRGAVASSGKAFCPNGFTPFQNRSALC